MKHLSTKTTMPDFRFQTFRAWKLFIKNRNNQKETLYEELNTKRNARARY